MDHYYVNDNPQDSGEHEVHKESCPWLPSNSFTRTYLGYFASCIPAIAEAKKRHLIADGCYWCCRTCHTR